MDIETYHHKEQMLKLREKLLVVEEERLAGNLGCTPDELEDYLNEIIYRDKNAML